MWERDEMTKKELKRLSRLELLELTLELTRENELLRQQLEENRFLLKSRKINIEKAGSIAEAALQLSGIFEAAQEAAELYLENLQLRTGERV